MTAVQEALDVRLLAEAFEWAGDEPAARGRTFNLTNGDVFLWPACVGETEGADFGSDQHPWVLAHLDQSSRWGQGLYGPSIYF